MIITSVKTATEFLPKKGDLIVAKNNIHEEPLIHYLIVEDKVKHKFTMVNLDSSNTMVTILADTTSELLECISNRMPALEIVEIIPRENISVILRKNSRC
jgi:hypothetical protein